MKVRDFLFLLLLIFPLSLASGLEINQQYSDLSLWHVMSNEYVKNSKMRIIPSPQTITGEGYWDKTMQFYLREADRAREQANVYLNEASKHADLIPSISIKEQLQTLISSSIGSIAVPDPRGKFLTISLAMIADLVNQLGVGTFEKYFSLRKNLALAATYLERSNYFLRLALSSPLYSGTKEFNEKLRRTGAYVEESLQWLILIDMYTTTMECKFSGRIISSYFYDVRNSLIIDVEKNGIITKKHSDKLEFLSENIYEIFSLCSKEDQYLVDEVYRLLEKVKNYLKHVENVLGTWCQDDYNDDDVDEDDDDEDL